MDISWLTFRDLEYVVAIADKLHFGRAASDCRVSQPALSAQLKKIEAQLGATLFERTNRRVTLTEKGREVAERARQLLDDARRLADVCAGAEPLAGDFRVGAIATVGPYLFPQVLPGLRKRFPKARFLLKEGLTAPLLEELRAGKLDVVLAARTFDEEAFETIALCEEPFLLAIPREHPLAAKERPSRRDLDPSGMVLLEDGHCLSDQTLALCPARRGREAQPFHATSLETLRFLVASGVGYTLLPQLAARSDERLDHLVRYRRLAEEVGRELVLVHRKRYPRAREAALLADAIRAGLPAGLKRRG